MMPIAIPTMRRKKGRFRCSLIILSVSFCLLVGNHSLAQTDQPIEPDAIRALIEDMKSDARGPFQGIRWFCPDGTVLPAQSRCPTPGGFQHGLHKDAVARLATRNHLFLGQVLAGTDHAEFLDEGRDFSRLKQYIVERYLFRSDDGWIFRRARYYRGALQAEDEEKWGRAFLEWMLARTDLVQNRFFLVREAVRDVPHGESDNLIQRIRSTSKEISDGYAPFLETRIKIHGQPDASDTLAVASFEKAHGDRVPTPLQAKMDLLREDLRKLYASDPLERLKKLSRGLAPESRTRELVDRLQPTTDYPRQVRMLANAMVAARKEIEGTEWNRMRLRLMDMSLEIETIVFRSMATWHPRTVGELIQKFESLTDLALGSGLLEWWEADNLDQAPVTLDLPFDKFEELALRAQRVIGWGVGMVTATFDEQIARFGSFEPRVVGFLDDRMRSTVLLAMGETASELASELGRRSGRTHDLMGSVRQGGLRGLNPGVAKGRLIVHTGAPEDLDFKSDAIYVLTRAPADLKPVAGIATVTEGNLVSHVQLLARNLGIPNAVISPEALNELQRSSGQTVFYAVSPRGVVVMKPASTMDDDELALVDEQQRSEEKIRVPTHRMDLSQKELATLADLRAGDSGRVCGPKAANLGQLSALFPERVAPGFIVPFGVFKEHMDQTIPAGTKSYWATLEEIFAQAETERSTGRSEQEVESAIISRLAALRSEIEKMPLKPEFVDAIRRRFAAVFGDRLGAVPVFVRSDTNMEDLKDFTGAGLNLTIPNVLTESDILQAIRRVWASPYRERGYRWRQKYLLNPQDVYPSLLILRSVNADKSGVMITTGVYTGTVDNLTLAFNRGVGGAVDGQAAEMYELNRLSAELISPAREPKATVLPVRGGVAKEAVSFSRPILSRENLVTLRAIGSQIRRLLPGTPGVETQGPFDVELGFKSDHLWLFQARPFVENRSAAQSTYLSRLDTRNADLPPLDPTESLGGSL